MCLSFPIVAATFWELWWQWIFFSTSDQQCSWSLGFGVDTLQ